MIDKAHFLEIKARCDQGQIKSEDMKWLICELEIMLYKDSRKLADSRRYYHEHREERIAKAKKYRDAHREESIEYAKTWRALNPDKDKASRKRYYQKHKERLKAKNKQYWREKHGKQTDAR